MDNILPKGWAELRVKDFAFTASGGTPSTSKREYWDNGNVPWINSGTLKDGMINKPSHFITELGLRNSSARLFPKDTVVIALTGATTGRVGLLNLETSTNQSVTGIFPSEVILPKYLFYFLKGNRDMILAESLGSAQPHINKAIVDNTIIQVAPIEEQKRIVDKLDAVFSKVNNCKIRLEKISALLKNFRQSALVSAVSGELTKVWRKENENVESAEKLLIRFEEYRRTTYQEALKNAKKINTTKPILPRALKNDFKFEATETTELPDSWQWSIIDKIGVIALGGTPSRKVGSYWNGNINWISSGEVNNNRISDTFEKITKEGLKNSNAKVYPKGTVLLAMIGEGKTRGQSSILDKPSSTNQNVAAIILDNDFMSSEYVWFYLQSIYDKIRKDGSGGAQQALNGFLVGQINIAIPPLEEQKEIVRKVNALFHFADKIETRYQKANVWFDKLPQAILAKAFRGELALQNENDEPVNLLLERIKLFKVHDSKIEKAIQKNKKTSSMNKEENIDLKKELKVKFKKAKFRFDDFINLLSTNNYNDIKTELFSLLKQEEIELSYDFKQKSLFFKIK